MIHISLSLSFSLARREDIRALDVHPQVRINVKDVKFQVRSRRAIDTCIFIMHRTLVQSLHAKRSLVKVSERHA